MKSEHFIPDKVDCYDSDDSSIHGDILNANDNDISEEEEEHIDADGDYDLESISDSESSENDDDDDDKDVDDEDDDDKDATVNDANNADTSKIHEDADDNDASDCESTSSEEAEASMGEIFGTTPNAEANRNHPPNFTTDSPTLDLCFHPVSDLLATGSIEGDCVIYRYNADKVEEVTRFSHHQKSCRQVCFNENGTILYSVSKDKSLAIIDIQNSAIKRHLKDIHEAPIYSFLEVKENICATGDDDGTVKLWDLRKRDPVLEFKCGEQTVTSLLTCDKNIFLTATVADGSISGFNLRKRELKCQSEMFDSEFTCQSLVRNDSRLVVGSGSGIMYLFNWGEFGYSVDALSGHPDLVQCMASISENMIVTGCEDGNIRAIHLYDHRFIGVIGQHKDFGVENIAISCDGNLLASCSMDEEVQFWNIEYLYNVRVNPRKRGNKKASVISNLSSSRKRNAAEFFRDIPSKVESDDEGGPVPSTSYNSD